MLKEAWLLQALQPEQTCLNPYFNGTFSKSLGFVYTRNSFLGRVLILILMEHAQRAFIKSLVIVVVSVLS